MKFIGVTGTDGKTTTAILIASIMKAAGHKIGLTTTAMTEIDGKVQPNDGGLTTANPIDSQKVLRKMSRLGTEWVVMEVASHSLVQHRTLGIRYQAAVMTNLTGDHLDYHGSIEEYAAAKGRLFSRTPKLSVLNSDDRWFDFFNRFEAVNKVIYGTKRKANVRIDNARLGMRGSRLELKLDNHELKIKTTLPGKHNAYNILAAVAATYGLGVSLEHIKDGIAAVKTIPGRMELVESGQPFTVMIDHAHTPAALRSLLTTVRSTLKGRLICVVGADGNRDSSKRDEIGKVAAQNSEVVIITDQEPGTEDAVEIRQQVKAGADSVVFGTLVYEEGDRQAAVSKAFSYGKKGDAVVITGLGSQTFRNMKAGKAPWDDRKIAQKLLSRL